MSTPTLVSTRARVHTRYETSSGKRIPSVTTVLSVLAKPALVRWAHGLGLKGIDMDAYVDELAGIGTLAHRMILRHLKGGEDTLDQTGFSKEQIDLAENCFLKYLEWERQHAVEPLIVETPLVSELHGFGGTPDFYGHIDGQLCLMDFKTGKGIYEDHWYQLGGYDLLFADHPSCYRILNIGRDETERFVEEQRTDLRCETDIFLHTLAIYKLTRKRK